MGNRIRSFQIPSIDFPFYYSTSKIELTTEDRDYLQSLTRKRTIQAQVVDRAKTLLYKAEGIQRALFDDQRSGRRVEITDDAVAWIIDIACQRPADLGYAQELWTLKNLHKHIQEHAQEAGYPRLTTITKPMVHTISYNEKPGIQSIATTGEELRPTENAGCVYRDYEYKRLGTLSLLAGICDNHSAHKSKEVQNYLATRPEGRFVFVFTPTQVPGLSS